MLFRKTLDSQLEKGPKEVKFCTKCVVSNQRPRITFDEDGVCSACHYAYLKHNVIDWNKREQMLLELLDKHRSKDGSYDCVVPGSGGKDSSYVAHQLKYVYGMHPLTVTWAPFLYTDVGWQNYISFEDHGFDNLLFFPNGILYRKLARLGFELVGDGFNPFIYGQKAYPFHIAVRFKIPLIFTGKVVRLNMGALQRIGKDPLNRLKTGRNSIIKAVALMSLSSTDWRQACLAKKRLRITSSNCIVHPVLRNWRQLNQKCIGFPFTKSGYRQRIIITQWNTPGFKQTPTGVRKGLTPNTPVSMTKPTAFISIWHTSNSV